MKSPWTLPLSDHGCRYRADLLLQPLHWREQLDPPCGAHGDGGPHAGGRAGTHGGCGGHFPPAGMGRGQRSSQWQGLLLQSKHSGDQVGSSLRWKRQWLKLKFHPPKMDEGKVSADSHAEGIA